MSSYNGKIINGWLEAGYAVVTIEKSGPGDSYHCVPCSEVDLATDIDSYNAGYEYMEQLSYVDKPACTFSVIHFNCLTYPSPTLENAATFKKSVWPLLETL